MRKHGFVNFHLDLANQYLESTQAKDYVFHGLEDLELSTQLLLRAAIRRGVEFDIVDRQENFVKLSVETICNTCVRLLRLL